MPISGGEVSDPTKRFSNRVDDYVRYRPRYPSAVVDLLESSCGLTRDWVVADVGSGTGIFSEMLLRLGCRVYEVGISYSGRTYKEGKKINWKDGISAVRCLLKYNLFR